MLNFNTLYVWICPPSILQAEKEENVQVGIFEEMQLSLIQDFFAEAIPFYFLGMEDIRQDCTYDLL